MKKKKIKPKQGTKFVRVDHKTTIEVSVDKSDEEAIQEFKEKLEYNSLRNLGRRAKHKP